MERAKAVIAITQAECIAVERRKVLGSYFAVCIIYSGLRYEAIALRAVHNTE